MWEKVHWHLFRNSMDSGNTQWEKAFSAFTIRFVSACWTLCPCGCWFPNSKNFSMTESDKFTNYRKQVCKRFIIPTIMSRILSEILTSHSLPSRQSLDRWLFHTPSNNPFHNFCEMQKLLNEDQCHTSIESIIKVWIPISIRLIFIYRCRFSIY